MKYCKYHPLKPATYSCLYCHMDTCDNCMDTGDRGNKQTCIVCHKDMDSLGASYTSEPFWRRLQESFRYPLNANALTLIIGVSCFSTVLGVVPFAIFLYLLVLGAMMKYCFSCLEHTAAGNMVAPDITLAYSGGLRVLLHLLAMAIAVFAIVLSSAKYLGNEIAGLFAFIMLMGIPAMLINYALTESLAGALNVLNMLRLMLIIGLPYGLLIGFIMIMVGSVGVINELIGERLSLLSSIFQSIVSYYYMVVVFHLMGYMIFQYQGSLGFSARKNDGDNSSIKSVRDRLMNAIHVHLKEGNIDEAKKYFEDAVAKFPLDMELMEKCFQFLLKTKNQTGLDNFSSDYIQCLINAGRSDKLALGYKEIIKLVPGWLPTKPEIRYAIARDLRRVGDSAKVVKLIRGMHKEYPDFPHLVDAYEMMADSFAVLPNMEANAEKCRSLVAHLRLKMSSQAEASAEENSKPLFAAAELSSAVKSSSPERLPEAADEPASRSPEENKEETGAEEPPELPPIEFK